jgi:putative ABC transport system permease protein
MSPPFAVACYRALLRLLPAAWRAEHGEAMVATFESLALRAAQRGRLAVAAALLREVRPVAGLAAMPSVRAFRRQNGPAVIIASLLQDVRYTVRIMRASPGVTLAVLITLAVSIGANSAIFSVVHAVLLEPLPYREPERLVLVGPRVDGNDAIVDSTSPGNFYDWRSGQRSFERLAGYDTITVTLHGGAEPERIQGMLSAGSVLETLGVPPRAGRLLAEADDKYGQPFVIVLAESLATRLFGGVRDAIGGTVRLENRTLTVVGVMPSSFYFPDGDTQFWVPAQFEDRLRYSRTEYMLLGVGRLRDGVPWSAAESDLNAIMARIQAEYPRINDGPVAVRDMKHAIVSSVERPMLLITAAVSLVLLIACANLANLLLARAAARQHEMALRSVLGAARARLVRQLLTESLLVSAVGGMAGLVLSRWMLAALVAQLPEGTPRAEEIAIDGTVVLVTLGASIVCGVVFGLAPALLASGQRALSALRVGARSSDAAGWTRSWLVGAEIALAVMLLAGAGLLVRSFIALHAADPGIRAERLLTFRLNLPGSYPVAQRPAALGRALDGLERVAGVESAAAISQLPVTGRGIGAWLNIIGRPQPDGRNPDSVPYRIVTPDYFRAAGVKLVRGRLLDDGDGPENGAVVIDEALARKHWPHEDPVGREIVLGAMPEYVLFPRGRIVGVVGDVKQLGLGAEPPGMVYVPHKLAPYWSGFSVMVRAAGDPRGIVGQVRRAMREFDPLLPLASIRTMDEILAESTAPTRLPMLLVAAFAAAAIGLALLGVFSVLSYSVARRRRELAIRVALGAQAASVRRLVLGDGLRPAMAGIAVGVAGALAFSGLLEGLLYGVEPADPTTFVVVSAVLLVCSAVASYLPARRATEIDPIAVLKAE